jgi:hypothetical protein
MEDEKEECIGGAKYVVRFLLSSACTCAPGDGLPNPGRISLADLICQSTLLPLEAYSSQMEFQQATLLGYHP